MGIVAWSGLEGRAVESLRAVCAVLGMSVWQGSLHDLNGARKGSSRSSSREEINRIEDLVSVVIADSSQRSGWEHLGLHVICVGEGLRLPGGEKLLGQLLAADMARWIATQGSVAGRICVGIAGWSGGAGVSTLAWDLCRDTGSICVNLSGPGPLHTSRGSLLTPPAEAATWSSISVHEHFFLPSLIRELPVSRGVPYLGGDAHGGAYADDSRVPAVISALKGERSIVCDLGLWGPRCARISEVIDVLILLGHGDALGVARLCALSAANPPPCPTYALIAPRVAAAGLSRAASVGLISPSQITRIVHTRARPVYAAGMRPRQGRRGRKARAQLWERMEAPQ